MRALIVKGDSVRKLLKAVKQEKDSRIKKRLQALSLIKQGWRVGDVTVAMMITRKTVQNWVNRYNQEGRAGLVEKPRIGAPAKLKNPAEFCQRLDAGADVAKDKVSTWHGKEIQRLLKDDFGAAYALSSVYCLLHRLGYSSLKPRPYHLKADPAAQEAFKKTSVSKSGKSRPNIEIKLS
jgi:transposase